VTRLYDQLAERPRTAINHSSLNPTERAELRRIKVTQSTDITNTGGSDRFTTVYYLDGDEQQAAAVFVAKNEAQLEGIDFGSKNAVQQTVDREVYDWILHALGEHELEKYESVVRETRPDEAVTWMIDSDHYERYPMRRYSIGETPTVRIDHHSLDALYEGFDDVITASDLEAHSAIEGTFATSSSTTVLPMAVRATPSATTGRWRFGNAMRKTAVSIVSHCRRRELGPNVRIEFSPVKENEARPHE